jgi:uncharacterized protein (DUF779 family)
MRGLPYLGGPRHGQFGPEAKHEGAVIKVIKAVLKEAGFIDVLRGNLLAPIGYAETKYIQRDIIVGRYHYAPAWVSEDAQDHELTNFMLDVMVTEFGGHFQPYDERGKP